MTIHTRKQFSRLGHCSALILFALGGTLAPRRAQAAGDAGRDGLGLLANGKILWIYQPRTSTNDVGLVRFAYRTADDSVKGRYWRGPVVTGRVAAAALLGTNVHVFFSDGAHRRFSPIRFSITPTPSPMSWEMSLPDGALPIVLASDETRNALYAVVPTRVAEKIEADRARRVARERALEDDEDDRSDLPAGGEPPKRDDVQPDEGALALRDASSVSSDLAIVRYDRGRWRADRPGPAGLTIDDRVAGLSAHEGGIFLFVEREPASTPRLRLWCSRATDEPFEDTGPVPDLGAVTHIATGVRDGQVWIIASASVDSGTVASLVRWDGQSWSPPLTLHGDDGSPLVSPVPGTAALFGDAVAVATVDETGAPRVGLWSVETGASVEAPVAVNAIAALPVPRINRGVRHALQYAVLAGALIAVFVWRRERVLVFAPLKANQTAARLERRVLAFAVDLAVVAPVWMPVVFGLWRAGAPDMTIGEQLMQPQPVQSGPLFWAGAAVGAIFGLYAGILEWLLGQTLGKRIARCAVVGEGGERCTARAALVRNVLRIVEFHFVPLALLIALTPSRQRLGDMLARTVVIEAGGGAPTDLRGHPSRDRNPDAPRDHRSQG